MVDNTDPTSQFHPYQPQTAEPQSAAPTRTGLSSILNRVGIDQSKIDALGGKMRNTDIKGQINKARGVAQNNPGLVLGGLAALVIGAGLMRRRSR